MRVLLTTDTIGGVWTYTRELTEGVLNQSHAVALVSFGSPPSNRHLAWATSMQRLHAHRFLFTSSEAPLEWMQQNTLAYTAAKALLLSIADTFRADILHTNQFCFGKLPVPIPKLVVAHSDVLSWSAACRPEALTPTPWLDQYTTLVQEGLTAADALVAPTHWMLQALAANFSLPSQTQVILNGLDLPAPPPAPDRKLQAVTIGRLWDPAKGLHLLSGVSSAIPILAAGERQHASEFAPDHLGPAILLGPLDEASLLDLLRSSVIYLALSVYEPFGLAPLEAALCGCAILARDLPSLREVWGDHALYFDDANSLSANLIDLATNPARLQTLQTLAHDRARELSRTCMTTSYLDLYHRLLDHAPVNASQTALEVV